MPEVMTSVFWGSVGALVYMYAGYPVLVWALARVFGRDPKRQAATPTVSLVIPAYNEEAHIEAKLDNSLALDYPRDSCEIVVADDGSMDRTNEMAARFRMRGITLLTFPHRGKAAMLNRVMPYLKGEIVVFSDASSHLQPDALRRIVEPFADARVGCVSGLYQVTGAGDLREEGEGLYWRYETFIKRQESRLHTILGAHGAFYAVRKTLFRPLEAEAINDDYLIPMRIVAQGYRAVYEPAARAWERETASIEGEFARRRRIATGNCQQIVSLIGLLNPLRGWVALTFFSHKVLRTLAPLFMVATLLSSLWLPQPWQVIAVSAQGVLYASAWIGWWCQRRGRLVRWLSPPLYFCLGNLAMLAGLVKFCFSRNRLAWGRAR